MIQALSLLLLFQLGGEAASRAASLPIPGPVLGMVALTLALALSPRLMALMRPLAEGILAHLSLLFVGNQTSRITRSMSLSVPNPK